MEATKSIRACITGEHVTIVYADDCSSAEARSLLRENFLTLSLDGPVSIEKIHTSDESIKHTKKGKGYKV